MMMLIRLFEEALEEMFSRGLLHGTMHLSIGQEATATGACLALEKEDLITNARELETHFRAEVDRLGIKAKIKGAGLMIGLDFRKPTATLRKALLEESHLFVGSSSNANVVRILPPLNCTKEALSTLLSEIKRLS